MNKIKGLEYYSIDVNLFSDVRIFKLIKKYGPLGFASYMVLISHIYSKGYFVEYDVDTLAYLILKHIPSKYISGKNRLQEIIHYMVEIELFNQHLFKKGILTSYDIQEMFLHAAKKRQKPEEYPYWLLEITEISEIGEATSSNVAIKPTKKQKRMNQKIKDIEEHAPKKHFLTSSLIEYGYLNEHSLDIIKFNELFTELETIYDATLIFQATRYLCNYARNPSVVIDDPFKYFEVSITSYLERVTKNREEGDKSDLEKLFENLFTK